MDDRHYPNPKTYRPNIGIDATVALIALTKRKNANALQPLGCNAYLRKIIRHWWKKEFPGVPYPGETEPYFEDFDFVQSA